MIIFEDIMSFFNTIFHFILDFIVPPICPICKKRILSSHGLCCECFGKIHFISKPFCEICGKPFEFDISEETICGACCKKKQIFTKARSAFIYDSFSAKLILPFKHSDHLELTPLLTKLIYQAGKDLFKETDLIIAVPLHRFRYMKRKYNQADLLAKALAKKTHLPYFPNILIRKRATVSQGHMKANERKHNVAGAFDIKNKNIIQNKNILIIDDVYTTGATINECTKILLKNKATKVFVLTLARVTKL